MKSFTAEQRFRLSIVEPWKREDPVEDSLSKLSAAELRHIVKHHRGGEAPSRLSKYSAILEAADRWGREYAIAAVAKEKVAVLSPVTGFQKGLAGALGSIHRSPGAARVVGAGVGALGGLATSHGERYNPATGQMEGGNRLVRMAVGAGLGGVAGHLAPGAVRAVGSSNTGLGGYVRRGAAEVAREGKKPHVRFAADLYGAHAGGLSAASARKALEAAKVEGAALEKGIEAARKTGYRQAKQRFGEVYQGQGKMPKSLYRRAQRAVPAGEAAPAAAPTAPKVTTQPPPEEYRGGPTER